MTSIQVQKRDTFGKKVKSLRVKGVIPAELYGRDFPNLHLSVSARDFSKIFKEVGESAIVNLKIKGVSEGKEEKEVSVLIHDVARDPLTDQVIHIDFYQVRMDEKITASIPLHFIGEAPALKKKDGILVKAMHEIEVESLPGDLPHDIKIDVSSLEDIGKSLYVRDIKPIKGVKLLVDPETVIVTVTEPVKEEVIEKPVSIEDIKVEGEEKKTKEVEEKKEEREAKSKE